MTAQNDDTVEVENDPSEDELDPEAYTNYSQAVVFSTDWTTETIVTQIKNGNIQLTPAFQRRDAWNRSRKSRLIESLILGFPVPQIVLAEVRGARGKYLVLDGKQRLLTLQQYWGMSTSSNNAFRLSSLEVLDQLAGYTYRKLSTDPATANELAALQNQPIRTVIIRNWPTPNFLHLVFLRLNTGSMRLSPQELRLALLPGEYTQFVDEAASSSVGIQKLLNLSAPDPRMRDTEILARYVAFAFFLNRYGGRMKTFLDDSFDHLNRGWVVERLPVAAAVQSFEDGVSALIEVFGVESVARKPGSTQFNKAIFDALIFYARDLRIRAAMVVHKVAVKKGYLSLFDDGSEFRQAVELDTAGLPNTIRRLVGWGRTLKEATKEPFELPRQEENGKVTFAGFFV